MMGGVTDPSTPREGDNNIQILPQKPVKAPNTNQDAVQGQGVAINLAPVLAQESTNAQTG
jgi:hypothetical protein